MVVRSGVRCVGPVRNEGWGREIEVAIKGEVYTHRFMSFGEK